MIARTQGQFKPEELAVTLALIAWGISSITAGVAFLVAVVRLIQSIFKASKAHLHAALSWLAIPLLHLFLILVVVAATT